MSRRSGADGPDGLVVVDKEAGWTSHDVVAKSRGLLGTRKVGHSGTLDPDATGILLLGVGRVTRLLRFLTALPKTYTCEMVLGTETSTLDDSGVVTATHDMSGVDFAAVAAAARGLTGDILQIPPMVSAVKIDGRRLHELAREGVEVERAPRPVTVHRFDVAATVDPLVVTAEVECSSGTYVRTLAADLGSAVGGGGHLRNLRRTAVGSFGPHEAHRLESVSPAVVLTPAEAMRDYPSVVVGVDEALDVGHGKVLPLDDRFGAEGPWAVLDETGRLLAVYAAHRGVRPSPRSSSPRSTEPPARLRRRAPASGSVPPAMEVLFDADACPRPEEGTAVTIGAFDGVHRGHRQVIATLRRLADERGLRTAVVTFDRHPASVVRPDSAPALLTDLDQKLELLADCGVDYTLVVHFDEARSKEPASDFVSTVLVGCLNARLVAVGDDFHFGHRRAGNVALLKTMGADLGFDVVGHPLVQADGSPATDQPVSSTRIRQALADGELDLANEMLGREHEVRGVVGHGDGRARELGYRTANVGVPDGICLPADGIYAGWYLTPDGEQHPTAISLGRRPTFYEFADTSVLEAHLIDFDGDLYGQPARVRFTRWLRDELKFDSVEALVEQMGRDVDQARTLLA